VLVQIQPDHEYGRGDAVYAVRTAEELHELGVNTDVSGSLAPDLSSYDLVHLFTTGIVEPTFRHTLRARTGGRPIVLTPIFWRPPLEDESFADVDRANLRRRDWAMRDMALGLADALLPPSRAELEVISSHFSTLPRTIDIVPVGVDETYAGGDGERFCNRHGLPLRGFILCVGRCEERKNQLRLIEACEPLGVPLVLIGAEYEDRPGYVAACRDLAERLGADVRFLSYASPEEVVDAYAAARVHALPSIWETIGVVSLEAALGGCNVVSTRDCGVGEYLGELAWYCDPELVESIHDALAAAFAAPLDDRLGNHVAERFTWRQSAERTLAAYEAVMSERGTDSVEASWRAALTPEQYIEHLESLIQLQLETIALRDGHYANAREQAERATEYAQSLEQERAQRDEYVQSLEQERSGARSMLRSGLRRFRR
jgi:glycosyltransferase involved in cell wall biosynthesis